MTGEPKDRTLLIRVNCYGSWARLVRIRESDLPACKKALHVLERIHVGGIKFDAQYLDGEKLDLG